VKDLENDIKQKKDKLRADQLIDPMQERRILQVKDEIEKNMKEINKNFKTLTNLIVDIKNYSVDSYGD